MTPIRTNNIYISSQLHRWLKWLAELDPDMNSADAVAECILRAHILAKCPNIEQLETDYWTARNKLDSETVNKLKAQTETTDKPM
jgi:hypothetical protein